MHVPSTLTLLALASCVHAGPDADLDSPRDGVLGGSTAPVLETTPVQISEYPEAPFEDRHGTLWICTAFDGLIRYDGAEFVAFTTADGLGSNTVRDIIEDEEGTLWVATAGGLSRHDGTSFTTLTEYEPMDFTFGSFGIHGNHRELWGVMQDRHGSLWIATMDGAFRRDGAAFSHFPLPALETPHVHEFTSKMVYCVFEDQDGALWFGTDGAGVVRYDGETQVAFTTKDGLCSDHVCSIVQDRQGLLWFGTSNGGVSRYDGKTFTTLLRNPTFSEHNGWGRFLGMVVDGTGDVWFGRASPGGGVHRYDGKSFEYLSVPEGLGTGGVISLRADRSGTVWVGSTSGVFHYEGQRFVNLAK